MKHHPVAKNAKQGLLVIALAVDEPGETTLPEENK